MKVMVQRYQHYQEGVFVSIFIPKKKRYVTLEWPRLQQKPVTIAMFSLCSINKAVLMART